MAIWNPAEILPREQLEALQLERLRACVARVLRAVAPLAARLRAAGIADAREIGSLADLRRLPFTTKADLRDHYPFGLLGVPRDQVVRVHASSGTRGKPSVAAYTRNDLGVWNEVMARCMTMAGVRPGMVVHNAYGYGLFTGGLGFHQGAELIGCTVVPISGGFTQRQAMLLRDFGGNVLCATPSYALNIAEALERDSIDPRMLKLELGLFGAEPWTEQMRGEIERRLGLTAINMYGLSEIVGPGVSGECREVRNGSHVHEDHFLPEIIDPETGEVLPDGSEGELVFTSLTKEALPIIRYRTRDLTRLLPPTARAFRRMGKIVGRTDDMLIIRGVNVFPTQIEEIVLAHGQLSGQYQLLVSRDGLLDQVEVHCELQPGARGMDSQQQQEIAGWVKQRVKTLVGITTSVSVLAPDSIERTLTGKARRVVDKRPR